MAVHLDWASRSAIDMPTTAGAFSADDPITLGKCKIDMRLSKRPIMNSGYFAVGDATWSEGLLHEKAFALKTFTIHFAQGSFISGADIKWKKIKDLWNAPRFSFKMTMDPSPYPAREEWVDPVSVEAFGFWNWNVFVAEKDGQFAPKKEDNKSFGAKMRGLLKKIKI
jgi:hypothetical protein